MWCEGTVEGVYRRQSLKTRSWERAEEIRREIETGKREQAAPLTIADAICRFLHDAEHGRKLTLATLKKYRVLLFQLSEFSAARGLTEIADADVDFAREFRASWKDGPYIEQQEAGAVPGVLPLLPVGRMDRCEPCRIRYAAPR